MANTACFIIVGQNDIPIYEAEVGSAPQVLFLTPLFQFLFWSFIYILIRGGIGSSHIQVCTIQDYYRAVRLVAAGTGGSVNILRQLLFVSLTQEDAASERLTPIKTAFAA